MRILVVGDTHANTPWWNGVVVPAAAEHHVDGIIQVGDFGYWAGDDGATFISTVADSDVPVWFIDGNHEDHLLLGADVAAARRAHRIADPTAAVPLVGNLHHLPRGGRLELDGVNVCGLGGAVSIDADLRSAGIDWFADEHIRDADLENVARGGPADVLICHDAPSGYRIPRTVPPASMLPSWRRRLPSCEAHRELIDDAIAATRPDIVIHGHYHSRYRHHLDTLWGPVSVEGLGADTGGGAGMCLLHCSHGVATVSDTADVAA